MDLPDVAGRTTLRAALAALDVRQRELPPPGKSRDAILRRLAERPHSMAFIDISHRSGASNSKLLNLAARIPWSPVRKRIVLTRLFAGSEVGHVSDADRRWVRGLGFADFIAELDATDCEGSLRTAIDLVAGFCDLERLAPEQLAREARAIPDTRISESPQARLRALCGTSADGLCELMQNSIDCDTHAFGLKVYPRCFIGREAVNWLARRFQRTPNEAVVMGQALMSLGLLASVGHEQTFQETDLLYCFAVSAAADTLDPWEAFAQLTGPDGPLLEDRYYRENIYARCWIGTDGVSCLVKLYGIHRFDAWVLLHRLAQFGLIEHITRSHPFSDSNHLYRFTGLPGLDSAPGDPLTQENSSPETGRPH